TVAAALVTEAIEQRFCGRGIVKRFRGQRGIMAAYAGRHDLVRRNRLPSVHNPRQFLGVERERDGAAERNARVAYPADVGIGDIEIEVEAKRLRKGNPCYAACCVCGFELADVRAGGLDHFASRGADDAQQIADVRIVGLVQSYLEGIAADRAQPFDGSIEVELTRGARRVDDGSRADDEVGKNRRSATAAV